MSVSAQQLTSALQQQLTALEEDLRARVDTLPGVRESWDREHREALRLKRTAASWQQWRDERVMQAAVAWLLTTVFVRFCEDDDLVAPVWIAGLGGGVAVNDGRGRSGPQRPAPA